MRVGQHLFGLVRIQGCRFPDMGEGAQWDPRWLILVSVLAHYSRLATLKIGRQGHK